MARTIAALIFLIVAAAAQSSTELSPLVVVERQGNSSLECIASGRCESCGFAEKQNEEIFHCSLTGYYMPYNCVEVKSESSEVNQDKSAPAKKESIQKVSQRKDGGVVRKKLNEEKKIYHINRSCTPYVAEDKLSVLGFEGIMLGLLAVFSPVLYFRKKRGSVPSGMIRLPASARF